LSRLSAVVTGVDLSSQGAMQMSATSFALTEADLRITTHGLFEWYALMALGPMVLPPEGDMEAAAAGHPGRFACDGRRSAGDERFRRQQGGAGGAGGGTAESVGRAGDEPCGEAGDRAGAVWRLCGDGHARDAGRGGAAVSGGDG
jgi:hypothetical protein